MKSKPIYFLMGQLDLDEAEEKPEKPQPGPIDGGLEYWVNEIARS